MAASPGLAWTTAIVAFVIAVPLWRISMYAITLAHEGGHALIGLILGGKLAKKKIVLNRDGGGATHLVIGGLGRFLMLLAGYLGPSAVGYAGVQMLIHGFDPRTILIINLVFAIFVLVLTRNLFGLLVAAGTAALLWTVAMRAAPDVQRVFAYVWVWFMLIGSTRVIPHLYRSVARQTGTEDPELLQKHTHVGDVVWLFVFWLGTVAALVYGGAALLRHPA
jgi:Peptidase M50B-like